MRTQLDYRPYVRGGILLSKCGFCCSTDMKKPDYTCQNCGTTNPGVGESKRKKAFVKKEDMDASSS